MAESLLTPAQLALLEETDGLRLASTEALALRALGVELRDALSGEVDVADDVMLAIALNDMVGGGVDVADDVMLAIALNDAVGGGVDMADEVMDEIEPVGEVVQLRPAARASGPAITSRWGAAGGIGVVFAMAAAVLFSITNTPRAYQPVEIAAEVKPESIQVASFNEAEIEDLNTADNATVTVMQFDEGGPTIILVSDSEG